MPVTPAQKLRSMIGEDIPDGGTEADTLFTDEWIDSFIEQGSNDLDAAAYYGWLAKAGKYANLVDTTEGSSSRKMGALLDNAEKMVKRYGEISGLAITVQTSGRTRIGKIVRT